ncbi:MAG: hypothetical protein AAF517_17690 [Planctomycetota bacterium]
MAYELWWSEEEPSYSFFPESNESARGLHPIDAQLVRTFEARSWEDACRQKHEFLGWEPYRPMDSSDSSAN